MPTGPIRTVRVHSQTGCNGFRLLANDICKNNNAPMLSVQWNYVFDYKAITVDNVKKIVSTHDSLQTG